MLKLEIDLFGAVLLLMIWFNQRRTRIRSMDDRLFNAMLLYGIAMQLIDAVTWFVDGKQFPGARALNYASELLFYLGMPFAVFLWARYCIYRVTGDEARLKRETWIDAIPAILCAVLSIGSLFTPLAFGVTEDNTYYRGPCFPFVAVMSYILVIYVWWLILKNLRHVSSPRERQELLFMLVFPIPVLLGSAIQAVCYGLLLAWPGYVLSVMMLYLNVQNRQLTTDALTHLNNRLGLERYLNWRTDASDANDLYAVMLDIDNFKAINDRYGHAAGDRALIGVADILRRTCDKRDAFLARIGGDEFLIISPCARVADANAFTQAIDKAIIEYNASSGERFRIALSYGISRFDERKPGAFITLADDLMYQRQAVTSRR